MHLTRPLNFIDCETTGLNIARDRIVELAIVQLYPDGSELTCCWRLNPGIPIPAQVKSIHGLSLEVLKSCPSFKEKAAEILSVLKGCDLAGFNLINFDVPLIWEEFHRAGIAWDLSATHIIDVGSIFRSREPRNLANALRFYCKRQHPKAHDALADVRATVEVLEAQLSHYPDLSGKSVREMAQICQVDRRVDLAGMVQRDGDGDFCYNFGGVAFDHHTGTGLKIKQDARLANWALTTCLPIHTQMALREALSAS